MNRTDQFQPAPDRDAAGDADADADALNAYLDQLTGAPGKPVGELSPDLRHAATHLFALSAVAGPLDATKLTKESTMNATATSPLSLDPFTTLPRATRQPTTRPPSLRRLWTHSSRAAQVASTAAVVLLTLLASLGVFRAFDPSGGDGDGEGFYRAVPVATVPDDAVTSSIPYPTTAECTATPRTREEMAALLRTPPSETGWDTNVFSKTPNQATADEILAIYRHLQACTLISPYHRYSAELMTDEGIRFEVYNGPFDTLPQPLEEAEIEQALALFDEAATYNATLGNMVQVTNALGTPIAAAQFDKYPVPTIFPEDLYIADIELSSPASPSPNPGSPTEIRAHAYRVEPTTREVLLLPPLTIIFSFEDGRWLVTGQRVQTEG